MKGISGFISLLLASTIFLGSFLVQFFLENISIDFFIRNMILFSMVYLITKVLLGYVEVMFENCRKIL